MYLRKISCTSSQVRILRYFENSSTFPLASFLIFQKHRAFCGFLSHLSRRALGFGAGSFPACLHLPEGGRSTAGSALLGLLEVLPPPAEPAQRVTVSRGDYFFLPPALWRVWASHLLVTFSPSREMQESGGFGRVKEGICRR